LSWHIFLNHIYKSKPPVSFYLWYSFTCIYLFIYFISSEEMGWKSVLENVQPVRSTCMSTSFNVPWLFIQSHESKEVQLYQFYNGQCMYYQELAWYTGLPTMFRKRLQSIVGRPGYQAIYLKQDCTDHNFEIWNFQGRIMYRWRYYTSNIPLIFSPCSSLQFFSSTHLEVLLFHNDIEHCVNRCRDDDDNLNLALFIPRRCTIT
jgi:hypothetical protein